MQSFTRNRWRRSAALLIVGLLVQALAQAADTAPPSTPPPASTQTPLPQVRVTTNMGEFVIEVRPDRAPLTVANFLRYVREGFYTDTIFHRVVANFVVQGGGHGTDDRLKPTHDPVVNESGNGLQNKRGAVGLARGDSPHSGNAQIYIDLVDNPDLDPLPTRWGYAVFGKVIQGMDTLDRIGVTPTGPIGPFKSDAPLKPVIIQKIELMDAPTGQPGAPVTTAPATAAPPPAPEIRSPQ